MHFLPFLRGLFSAADLIAGRIPPGQPGHSNKKVKRQTPRQTPAVNGVRRRPNAEINSLPQCKSIEERADIPHLGVVMTYKDFYAQAMLSSLPIAYAVEKDLMQGREPTPENVALGASQLAMALTELLAKTIEDVPGANQQY
jgi:hypothetical protein